MDDKELIELAAKAARYDVEYGLGWNTNNLVRRYGRPDGLFYYSPFNPLEDDGDAFRLAVKLSINVSFASIPTFGDIYAQAPDVPPVFEHVGGDVYAATRRAIVLSAANIGRNMR